MAGTTTGTQRLRLGAKPGWRAGDKTGSGANNTVNDVAYLWPTDASPVLVCCYTTAATAAIAEREAVMAEIGRRAAALSPAR
jgi:beta-lactamase class A